MKKFFVLFAMSAALGTADAITPPPDGLNADGGVRRIAGDYLDAEYFEAVNGSDAEKKIAFAVKEAKKSDWYYLKLYSDKGIPGAAEAVKKLFEKTKTLADSGDAKAQNSMVGYYSYIEDDDEKARQYLKLAYKNNYREAIITISYWEDDADGEYARAAFNEGEPLPLMMYASRSGDKNSMLEVIAEFERVFPDKKEVALLAYVETYLNLKDAAVAPMLALCREMVAENPKDLRIAAIIFALTGDTAEKADMEGLLKSAPSELTRLEYLKYEFGALDMNDLKLDAMRKMYDLGKRNAEMAFGIGMLLSAGYDNINMLYNISEDRGANIPDAICFFEKAYETAAGDDSHFKPRAAFSLYTANLFLKNEAKARDWLLKYIEIPQAEISDLNPYVEIISAYYMGRNGFEKNQAEAERLLKKLEGIDNEAEAVTWIISELTLNLVDKSHGDTTEEERFAIARSLCERIVDRVGENPGWVENDALKSLLRSGVISEEYAQKLYEQLPHSAEIEFEYAMYFCADQKKPAKGLPYLERAAQSGNADAMLMLYAYYFSGRGVAADTELAETWLKKALKFYEGYPFSFGDKSLINGLQNIKGIFGFKSRVIMSALEAALTYPKYRSDELYADYLRDLLYSSGTDEAALAKALDMVKDSPGALASISPIDLFKVYSGWYGAGLADGAKAAEYAKVMYERPELSKYDSENRIIYPLMVYWGKGAKEDRAAAAEMLEKVKNEDGEMVPEAAALLGYFYSKGLGVAKDAEKAQYYRNIAKNFADDIAAFFGGIYDFYVPFPKDDDEAQYYWDEYAKRGAAKNGG